MRNRRHGSAPLGKVLDTNLRYLRELAGNASDPALERAISSVPLFHAGLTCSDAQPIIEKK